MTCRTRVGSLCSFAAAAALTAVPLGCGVPAPTVAEKTAGVAGVAIIDLDAVAQGVGFDKQIVQAVQQRQAALNTQLVGMAKTYVGQLEEHRKTVADQEAGKVKLAQYQEKANQNLGVAKQRAQQNLAKHRSLLVQRFRETVRPAAREAARERGLSLIVTKQDSLLFDYTSDADITQAVIAKLRGNASQIPAPPRAAPAASGATAKPMPTTSKPSAESAGE